MEVLLKLPKLVRSKIPSIIEANNKKVRILTVDSRMLTTWLVLKLKEESEELGIALASYSKGPVEEELVDLLEIIYTICDNLDIPFSKIREKRIFKKREVGDFSSGIVLIGVE